MRRSIEQRTVRSFCRRQPGINVRPNCHYTDHRKLWSAGGQTTIENGK